MLERVDLFLKLCLTCPIQCSDTEKTGRISRVFNMRSPRSHVLIHYGYVHNTFSQYTTMCIRTFGLLTVSWQNVSITFLKSHDNSHDLFSIYIDIVCQVCINQSTARRISRLVTDECAIYSTAVCKSLKGELRLFSARSSIAQASCDLSVTKT